METVRDFILGGSRITADGVCSHEIKRPLLSPLSQEGNWSLQCSSLGPQPSYRISLLSVRWKQASVLINRGVLEHKHHHITEKEISG